MIGVIAMMKHRAVIQRDGATGTNDYGHPEVPSWATLATVKCRADARATREVIDGDKIVTVKDVRMAVPLGTDVTASDRVLNITNSKGTEIVAGPLVVDGQPIRRESHLEVLLQARAS